MLKKKLEAFIECRLKALKATPSVVSAHSLPQNPVPISRMLEIDLMKIKGTRVWSGQYCQVFKDDIAGDKVWRG